MELTEEVKTLFSETAQTLKRRERRVFMARVVNLLLNQDNGPENHSRRTQFIKRLVDFVNEFRRTVKLAYYPPYHSKYNPNWKNDLNVCPVWKSGLSQFRLSPYDPWKIYFSGILLLKHLGNKDLALRLLCSLKQCYESSTHPKSKICCYPCS